MIWNGMDESAAILLGKELHDKWIKDNHNLEMAKSFRIPEGNQTRKKMSEPKISTNSGMFASSDIKSLRKALTDAAGDDRRADMAIKWRGQDVHVPFGWYLVEYVEGMLAQRNHGGL